MPLLVRPAQGPTQVRLRFSSGLLILFTAPWQSQKKNCQLLTRVPKLAPRRAKPYTPGLPVCLSACEMLVPTYIVGRCLIRLILRIYMSLASDNSEPRDLHGNRALGRL